MRGTTLTKPFPGCSWILAVLLAACSGGTGSPVPPAAGAKASKVSPNASPAVPSGRNAATPMPSSENTGVIVVSNLRDQQRDDTEPVDVSDFHPTLVDDKEPLPVR